MKTRRNRKVIQESTNEHHKALISQSSSSSHAASTQQYQPEICHGLSRTWPNSSAQSVEDVGYTTSTLSDGDTSSDDRRSACSSPLSDSSFSGSSTEDDYSTDVEPDHATFPSQWFNHTHGNRESFSPLLDLDSDVMAQILTFLEPSEILHVLTMPLCKNWQNTFGSHQDLWKTLCLLEPFKANIREDPEDDDSSTDSFSSLAFEPAVKNIFGEYRLMFTSFVRCLRYLDRIQEDARSGRALSVADYGQSGFPHFGVSKSLKKFLSKKKDMFSNSEGEAPHAHMQNAPVGVTDDGYRKRRALPSADESNCTKKVKYGNSMITSRLLGPSSKGQPSHLKLPRSCAIYSIVNWMVAYPEVEGIQIRCVSTLPVLLEDESQRLLAQRIGLVEVVLKAMLRFPVCPKLHIAAFHAMVLLARPLGGREGMLFDNSMAESTSSASLSYLSSASSTGDASSLDQRNESSLKGINGIFVMLSSMRRFALDPELQAMSCWALVNLALVPAQKTMILSLGGIEVTVNAMRLHPNNFDVQFRALFALINLVVTSHPPKALSVITDPRGPRTEKDVLDTMVDDVASLVVSAMKNFCSSGTILNRACLVLHNLAQNQEYLPALLWTPHCFQMLEWCIANYPTDAVLRRSASSTLHRLQVLLSNNPMLRTRFAESNRVRDEVHGTQGEQNV